MIDQLVIPAPDAMPIPAPIWLLKGLLLLTFLLHIVLMNLTLGGSFIAFITDRKGRTKNSGYHLALAKTFSKMIPVTMAFTITLGVAPLLFLQVLYGQLFYTATVLMAWQWLSVILFVILAYYVFYFYSYRWEKLHDYRPWVVVVGTLLMVVVAFMLTSAMTLMLDPQKFAGIFHANPSGTHWNTGEVTLIPRLLHFLVAAVAVTGLAIVIHGLRKMKSDEGFGRWALRYGASWFSVATIVQMGIGIWFLLSLPKDVMMLFMGQNILATVFLGLAFLMPVASIMLILLASRSEQPRTMAIGGITVLGLTLVVMVIIRDLVRDGYLAGMFDVFDRTVEPQWGVLAVFGVIFIAGLGVVAYMLNKVRLASRQAQA